MTTTFHTDITAGAPANAAVVNAPLGQLDAALSNLLDKGGMAWNVKHPAYGAKGDGQVVKDAGITNGQAILTSASNKFASGDVGKLVVIQGAGAAAIPLVTTILSYQSAGQVTLNANAGTTVTNAQANWATNDTTAILAAIAAAGPNGLVVYPGGGSAYGFTSTLAPALTPNATAVGQAGGQTWWAYGALFWYMGAVGPTVALGNTAISGQTFQGFVALAVSLDCLNIANIVGFNWQSWYRGRMFDCSAFNVSGASTPALRINAPVGTLSINNSGFNQVDNFYTNNAGYGIELSGNLTGTVVTDNQFFGIHLIGIATAGVRLVQWCDSNYWQGVNIGLQGSTGTAVIFNDSATPAADVGVYNQTFFGVTCDAFNAAGGPSALTFNVCKLIRVFGILLSPPTGWAQSFTGLVNDISGRAVSYEITYLGQNVGLDGGVNDVVTYSKGAHWGSELRIGPGTIASGNAGDLTVSRGGGSPGTGYIFYGTSAQGHYIGYDSTAHVFTDNFKMLGKVQSYQNVNTAGVGVPPIFASYRNTGLVAAVANAINYTPPAAVGAYRLHVHYRPTATGASTSVGVTVTYKDSTGAISYTTIPFTRRSTSTVVPPPFLNTGADDFYVDFPFEIDNSATAITVSTTGTFTGTTYNLAITLEQMA